MAFLKQGEIIHACYSKLFENGLKYVLHFRDNNILDLQRYNFLNKNECKEN